MASLPDSFFGTPPIMTFEDYLLWEQDQEERHEFINGQIVAMAGASDPHELVALNLTAAVHGHLRGKGCRVYKGDMRLRFQAGAVDLTYYPDVMVTCDPADTHPVYKVHPKLLAEVMTRFKQDHFEKLFIYQQIASLEEYLILDQDPATPQAWVYRRENHWIMPEPITSGEITLTSIDLSLRLEDLYVA